MLNRRLFLASACALATTALAISTPAWAKEPIPVVATFSILGDMVERVGGKHVEVTTLVGRDGDAHVFQPTPKDARVLSKAQLLFLNGLEFEGWLERLAEASSFKGTQVVVTSGIKALPFDGHDEHDDHDDHDHEKHDDHDHDKAEKHDDHDHDKHDDHDHDKAEKHDDHDHDKHDDHDHDKAEKHDDHDHDKHDDHDHDKAEKHDDHDHDKHDDHDHDKAEKHDDHDHDKHDDHEHDKAEKHDDHGHDDHAGHDHGAFDPHAWQSLGMAVSYVNNITAALVKADPDNAADYQANSKAYVAEIKALDKEIHAMMDALPKDKRTVVTSHDAFGYFGADYGLTFTAPQGISTESEASAADVAKLIKQIRKEGISAVFVESIADKRLLQQIANETGVQIGGTLYSGALSPKDGPAATYLDMMRHNATMLSNALGSK